MIFHRLTDTTLSGIFRDAVKYAESPERTGASALAEAFMQLRLDTRLKSWPPKWSGDSDSQDRSTSRSVYQFLHQHDREASTSSLEADSLLKAVDPSVAWDHITLTIEYEGQTFRGRLLSEDRRFMFRLYEKFLKEGVGKTMNEIGSLDIVF
jgi:hypothetical protein